MSTNEEISVQIGKEIAASLNAPGKNVDERLAHLVRAEELILEQEGTSLLDNFLDEMLELMSQRDVRIRCFVVTFIEKACKKDPEVMKRAISALSWLLGDKNIGVFVQKRVIGACTQLYPVILRWAAQRKSDKDVQLCWEAFCMLKQRIMEMLDSDNEGIRLMSLKFLEALILCQTSKTEFSETPNFLALVYHVSLDEISRDHSFISYRKLASEAQHSFNRLIEQIASSHVSSLNLITAVACVCKIMRLRPEYFPQVISSLESLHVNLPPTLGTSQVKSVRKELKMHLLRLLKHPASFSLHNRITQLLFELGATQGEVTRAAPPPSEVSETMKRRVAAASAVAIAHNNAAVEATNDDGGGGVDTSTAVASTSRQNAGEATAAKRLKLDDDEYDDHAADIFRNMEDSEPSAHFMQKAFDISTDYVYERLSINIVTKLVIISLYTLPDQMPPAFVSSYTPIDEAGSDAQKRHLARMLAIQLTKEGEGPGFEYIKQERQKMFIARQAARSEGAVIPPTPFVDRNAGEGEKPQNADQFIALTAGKPAGGRARPQGFSLLTTTRELLSKEAENMFVSAFQRIMNNEKRAVQGGAGLAQLKLLVRLATRFDCIQKKEVEALLLSYVIEDQKNRTELALLWLAELYAQLQGFTICLPNDDKVLELSLEERYFRYDTLLCSFLSSLYERGEHKETLFHRIFLEVPLITPAALSILKMACVDKVYGAFAMTTLRELILTRARQRHELLRLLLEFSYFERNDIKEHCVLTAKELYQINYMRNDVREFVIRMSENLMQPMAPKVLWHKNGRMDKQMEEAIDELPWDEALIRAALHLFLALLPHDHTLLHQLAIVCARANTEIKRVTFRCIEQAIKSIGMQSQELLSMIENCPEGAETLIARVVHLLTERNAPTPELVKRVRILHLQRNTDVRSLIPILNGLEKDELRDLIPKFVLSATNCKSVPTFFRRLLFGRHIETHEPLMTPVDLIIELHRVKTINIKEQGHLISNLDLLIVDQAHEFNLSKEVFANAIELLIDENPLPVIFFHTLQKIHEHYQALNSFLSNVFVKLAGRRDAWQQNVELWSAFLRCLKSVGSIAYLAVLTQLSIDEFKEYVEFVGQPNLLPTLHAFVSSLSAHQQNSIPKALFDYVKDNNVRDALSELKKISPSFAHYGIEGGATAVVVLRWRGASCALVGSSGGRCALYSLDACALIATLWEDPQHRSIIAVGEWQLPNESVMSSSSNASSTSSCTHVWIHFRGSAIEVFQLVENAALTRLVLTGPRIPTGHYGFCTAISDWPHNRFIVPDYEDDKTVVKIRYAGGGEKCIRMDREFLTDAYLRSGDGDAPARLHAAQLDILQPFSGMLMAMEIFHEAIVDRTGNSHSGQVNTDDAVHYLFLAFEDSTVALYNTRLKRIVDFMKHPKHHEFVCWSVAEFSGANFDAKIFFSIATMKQAYLIGFDTSRMFFEAYGVIYKSPNISTTSLAMFPSTTADRRPRVACALASGVVEIYELSLRGEAHSTSIAIDDDDGGSDSKPVFHATKCYVIDFHAGHSITALRVFAEDVRNEKPPKRDDTPKQLLVVGCNVGKLSIYHL